MLKSWRELQVFTMKDFFLNESANLYKMTCNTIVVSGGVYVGHILLQQIGLEIIVEKVEIAHYVQFLLASQHFQSCIATDIQFSR